MRPRLRIGYFHTRSLDRKRTHDWSPEPRQSDNPLQAVQSAAGTGTSAGPAFIWILVIVAVVMAGLGWLRYRRSSTG